MTDHKSGKLKQTNKKHKGKSSKRLKKAGAGGKVATTKGSQGKHSRDLVRLVITNI